MKAAVFNRKLHRWGAIATALPLLLILGTGLLLQFKKEADWIQPPSMRGEGKEPVITFSKVLAQAKTVPEAKITGWEDIDRLDVRPGKGIIKVRAKNRWEIQVDSKSGAILQTAYRRSDLIESLHDGSFFHDQVKLWLFFPAAVVFFAVWITGIWLFLRPYFNNNHRNINHRNNNNTA